MWGLFKDSLVWMIETILIICALTFYTPYYDCSEEWYIAFAPNDMMVQSKNKNWYTGLTDIENKTVYIGNLKTDKCGNSLLGHELNHLKYDDASHKWYRNYGACQLKEFSNMEMLH